MLKVIAVAITAFVFVASVQAAEETPVPGVLEQCAPLNFQEKPEDFVQLNDLVNAAISSGLLAEGLQKADPTTLNNKTLGAIPLELLNLEFSIVPTIKTFQLTGLSTITPRQFQVASPENIEFGFDFNGTVGFKTTLNLEITQINRKKWHPCWTKLIGFECHPKVFNLQFEAAVSKPSVELNLLMAMLQCPANAQAGTCTDLTIIDVIIATVSKQFDSLQERILRRVKTMSIADVTVTFDRITELDFQFERSGPLMRAFFDKIADFKKHRLNKKKGKYEDAMKRVEGQIKTLGDQFIQEKLRPKFGNTCYGA